jgi:integrase
MAAVTAAALLHHSAFTLMPRVRGIPAEFPDGSKYERKSYQLSALEVEHAKPKDTAYRKHDGYGLALYVPPSGVRAWQVRYKNETVTIGRPDPPDRMSLKEAREKAGPVYAALREGKTYQELRIEWSAEKLAKVKHTFAKVRDEWIPREAKAARWSPGYRAQVEASLKNNLAELDEVPLGQFTAKLVSPHLAKIEERAPDMHVKVRRLLHSILNDAQERGIIPVNPLPVPRRRKRHHARNLPAVVGLEGVGEILRAARAADPCKGVQRAHELAVYSGGQRISTVVAARWKDFNLEAGLWTIPREEMKKKNADRGDHVLPLPPALLASLKAWRDADSDTSIYVCPAPRDPITHITREAVEKFYRRQLALAGKHSPHSWRSVFSTTCRNAGKPGELVDAQLDHVVGTEVQAVYDRATRLDLRRELMVWYEQQLITARDGAKVLPIKRKEGGARAKPGRA